MERWVLFLIPHYCNRGAGQATFINILSSLDFIQWNRWYPSSCFNISAAEGECFSQCLMRWTSAQSCISSAGSGDQSIYGMATRVTVTSPWAKAPPERGAGHVFVIVGRGSFMREVIVDVCMRKHLLNEWIIPYRRPRTFNSHSWLYYQHYWALTSVAVWSNPHYPPLMVSASLTPPSKQASYSAWKWICPGSPSSSSSIPW